MSEECTYLADIEKLNKRSQNILYCFLGGTIACPRCSRPGNLVYHKLQYREDTNNEEMAKT